ncbi:MAG: hypothetical protein ACKVU1_04485 [bacterium]
MAANPIRFFRFSDASNPIRVLSKGFQRDYTLAYLQDLGATSVVEEPLYFDRDYLSDFATFYAVSSRGYPNTCRRLHFFSGPAVTRDRLRRAVAAGWRTQSNLRAAYLGFVVLRPIPDAPFGRTVLVHYPESNPTLPRITSPARLYETHLAGITFHVKGLAWQQQDSRVSACATIAVWTMLHSSALDEHHAIPTTADITRYAHRTASLGARVFPSGGLNIYQLCEAIKESGLSPVVSQGEITTANVLPSKVPLVAFGRTRFLSMLACLVRSGYPALAVGQLIDPKTGESKGHHAICVTGFRECAPPTPTSGKVEFQDERIEYVYVHDDNIGLNVRFRVHVNTVANCVHLRQSAPPASSTSPNPIASYPDFYPTSLIAAVHEGVRSSPDGVFLATIGIGSRLIKMATGAGWSKFGGVTVSSRIVRLHTYLESILGTTLEGRRRALASTRLALVEKVPPMSLHVGLARFGWGPAACLDVLLDTTGSEKSPAPFCHVGYESSFLSLAAALNSAEPGALGVGIDATK